MTDIVYLCPSDTASSVKLSTKITKKGSYTGFVYYKGFEQISKYGYFNQDEIEKIKREIEIDKNKVDTLLSINKSELTPDIIKNFRYVEPVIEYNEQPVLIEPYILGLWLGDGTSAEAELTNIDIPIIERWEEYAKSIGHNITTNNKKERKTKIEFGETAYCQNYRIIHKKYVNNESIKVNFEIDSSGNYICKKCGNNFKSYRKVWCHSQNYLECDIDDTLTKNTNKVLHWLKKYNLIQNKHIPIEYLQNSFENRMKLLAGLIDTDGSLSRQAYEISQKNEQLSKDIIILCRSLGLYTRYTVGEKSCMYKGEKKTGTYYRIIISLNQFSKEIPVLLERKKWKYKGITQKNMCNPFIDINGNVLERQRNIWTDEIKIKLYSITHKIKQLIPENPIPWNKYKDFDIQFNNYTPDSLSRMYFDTLLLEKEKYDKLVYDIDIDIINFIELKWLDNYNEIKKMLKKGESILRSNNPHLYNFIYRRINLKGNNNINIKKKQLIDEIKLLIKA